MNKVILMGRLTRDPDIRYSNNGQNNLCIARYTLAVDRRGQRGGETNTDYISCVSMGKNAEVAEKYLRQGTKVVVSGRIQTGSYTNREGQKVYTTDVYVEEMEFAESRGNNNGNQAPQQGSYPRGQYGGGNTGATKPPQNRNANNAGGNTGNTYNGGYNGGYNGENYGGGFDPGAAYGDGFAPAPSDELPFH